MNSITVRAPAKINLTLRVGPRREDGFHELDTVYRAVSLWDTVTVREALKSAEPQISISGPYAAGVPEDHTNLAYRAVTLLAEHTGVKPSVELRIDKQIPHAAGLAGGSADAAATLVACNVLWGTQLPRTALLDLAAQLGSDVPFPVLGGDARGSGRGELLEPLPSRDSATQYLLIIVDAAVSTPAAFAELDRVRASGVTATDGGTQNDFHDVACAVCPQLDAVLRAVNAEDVEDVSVSGSGPTLVCTLRDDEHGERIAHVLRAIESVAAVYTVRGPVAGALG